MKNADLFPGAIVECRVSGKIARVLIGRPIKRHAPFSNPVRVVTRWEARNLDTGRDLRPVSSQRCRRLVGDAREEVAS